MDAAAFAALVGELLAAGYVRAAPAANAEATDAGAARKRSAQRGRYAYKCR